VAGDGAQKWSARTVICGQFDRRKEGVSPGARDGWRSNWQHQREGLLVEILDPGFPSVPDEKHPRANRWMVIMLGRSRFVQEFEFESDDQGAISGELVSGSLQDESWTTI
jgi:hypothetical protein